MCFVELCANALCSGRKVIYCNSLVTGRFKWWEREGGLEDNWNQKLRLPVLTNNRCLGKTGDFLDRSSPAVLNFAFETGISRKDASSCFTAMCDLFLTENSFLSISRDYKTGKANYDGNWFQGKLKLRVRE